MTSFFKDFDDSPGDRCPSDDPDTPSDDTDLDDAISGLGETITGLNGTDATESLEDYYAMLRFFDKVLPDSAVKDLENNTNDKKSRESELREGENNLEEEDTKRKETETGVADESGRADVKGPSAEDAEELNPRDKFNKMVSDSIAELGDMEAIAKVCAVMAGG